jgi:hypothetical protein
MPADEGYPYIYPIYLLFCVGRFYMPVYDGYDVCLCLCVQRVSSTALTAVCSFNSASRFIIRFFIVVGGNIVLEGCTDLYFCLWRAAYQ